MIQSPFADELAERLLDAAHPSGGWSYQPSTPRAAEPTALACLALTAVERGSERVDAALKWLLSRQQPDGAVPVADGLDTPGWTTALALLAYVRRNREQAASAPPPFVRHGVDWLLRASGRPMNVRTSDVQHDTSLIGWSWVAGTHSWVEPTCYALLALRAAGRNDDSRAREGVKLILDRAIPSGGWNYGNSAVLASTLRAFPETTGVALTALAGEPRTAVVNRGIEFLLAELPRIRSPLSLGWGLIGLTAWNARPDAADAWLDEAINKTRGRPANAMHDALLLLASLTTRQLACNSASKPHTPRRNAIATYDNDAPRGAGA